MPDSTVRFAGGRRWTASAFIGTLLAITALALLPGDSIDLGFNVWDKVQHAVAYGVLALLGGLAWPQRLATVAGGLALHGAAIEMLQQTLTTTRLGDWHDWLADCIGIAGGLAVRALAARRCP